MSFTWIQFDTIAVPVCISAGSKQWHWLSTEKARPGPRRIECRNCLHGINYCFQTHDLIHTPSHTRPRRRCPYLQDRQHFCSRGMNDQANDICAPSARAAGIVTCIAASAIRVREVSRSQWSPSCPVNLAGFCVLFVWLSPTQSRLVESIDGIHSPSIDSEALATSIHIEIASSSSCAGSSRRTTLYLLQSRAESPVSIHPRLQLIADDTNMTPM